MRRNTLIFSCIIIILSFVVSEAVAIERLKLATTTSTDSSGLLAYLLPPFERNNDCRVDVIAVGTGKALKLGEAGEVDVLLVHARNREERFVEEGYGILRRDVMFNDFVIVGPAGDPAGIRGVENAKRAFARLAETESLFVSRGDDSGTHTREKGIWMAADITPAGKWYLESGRGMAEVLIMADQLQAYTLSDRGTYLSLSEKIALQILSLGDELLHNPYGVVVVNPEVHPHVNVALARRFADYLVSDLARELIKSFRKFDQQLFFVAE